MQHKKIFPLFFLFILITGIFTILNSVSATSYYEWVQNPSFENYINYFEDAGAESNTYNAGVQYGNWTGIATFTTETPHSGLMSWSLGSSATYYLWYNLTNPKIGADVINASFWSCGIGGAGHTTRVLIYYSDGSYSDVFSFTDSIDVWVYRDILSYVNDAKYITAFKIYKSGGDGGTALLDDFVLYDVDDDAQYYISPSTKPWYESIFWNVDTFQAISSAQKHSGNWAYYDFIATGNEEYGYQDGVQIIQSFIGLDSDLINDFRLYAKTDNEIELTVFFVYSDETYSSDTKSVNASSWTLFVFDPAVADKTLVGFRIIPYSLGQYTVNMYLDDVSLTATVPFNPTPVIDSDHDGIPDQFDTINNEIPEEEEETYDTWYSNMVVTYMVLFIFVIVPPLIIAFEFSKHDVDPFMGFIGGLCLTVPIAYIVDIIDLWVLFVFVLGLILMILAKLGAFNRF